MSDSRPIHVFIDLGLRMAAKAAEAMAFGLENDGTPAMSGPEALRALASILRQSTAYDDHPLPG